MVLTGGEPALQVDAELIDALHGAGFKLAIETNGSIELPPGIDWITVSPKVAEHAIRQRTGRTRSSTCAATARASRGPSSRPSTT